MPGCPTTFAYKSVPEALPKLMILRSFPVDYKWKIALFSEFPWKNVPTELDVQPPSKPLISRNFAVIDKQGRGLQGYSLDESQFSPI
jgi:hypothetical protein